ncbi:phosphatase PAP2 family protein [Nocardioides hwasunensis]|uniref:Phosphatase PAP2 family protein n=1 Tax=Nocardioides hwasunensis TaxID=397258 RepID=A0ABR8MA16_9ACTN|nr:phosphatase PAP2 family protein [Nocardioides hwasunensis]MBD3912999.1 phosphatase PAP2 family protein [Nocardioides hwasunensis]
MRRGEFRAAAVVAAAMALAAALVAWEHHLPLRDPDGASLPTWFRLPVIVASAVALDVITRWVMVVRRGSTASLATMRAVVAERWDRDQVRFTVSGLVTWYVAYVAFRNLKSYVPFVTDRLADAELARIDRTLWLGHDPAVVLHDLLGTTWANWVVAAVYLIWIGLVPTSLAIALVWTRRSTYGAWYVTAISIDWLLGAILYYAVPSLGPTYSYPQWFASLPRTPNSAVRDTLLSDRIEVLAGPWDTHTVQTIAAFASLHVAVMVTLCLVVEAMRLPALVRVAAWGFLALTTVATVYLGWHFFLDTLAGAVVGAAAFVLAAKATGNPLRRRAEPWTFRAASTPRSAPPSVTLPSA